MTFVDGMVVFFIALWLVCLAGIFWDWATKRRIPVEVEEALKVLVNAGYDVERNGFHLYKRGTAINIVQWGKGPQPLLDETVFDLDKAVERFADLVAPKEPGTAPVSAAA